MLPRPHGLLLLPQAALQATLVLLSECIWGVRVLYVVVGAAAAGCCRGLVCRGAQHPDHIHTLCLHSEGSVRWLVIGGTCTDSNCHMPLRSALQLSQVAGCVLPVGWCAYPISRGQLVRSGSNA
jgi:hypothetical protein